MIAYRPRTNAAYTSPFPEASVSTDSTAHPRTRVIAIDGPAASGKSAVGIAVAARLGYRFVDTGAMYRAMTWLALRRHLDVHDAAALTRLAETVSLSVRTAPAASGDGTAVVLDGEDATPHLREPDVETNVSLVSRVPGVRTALVVLQRALAADGEIIMAGRDIGTVVLEDADLKVYLDASPRVRAERRAAQMRLAGGEPDVGALTADLARRDELDSTRTASPLTPAPDAVIINTDDLTLEEVVERIVERTR